MLFWLSYLVGQSEMHSVPDNEKSAAHAVQLVVVVSHLVQVLSHCTHTLLIAISLVFIHSDAQVKLVVKTKLGSQDVQVVTELAHVKQFESQATQVLPVKIVLPASQVLTQVLVLKSSSRLELQDVQLVVVPEHVLQFELQETHCPRVSFWMYISLGHDVIQILFNRNLYIPEESHEVQVVAVDSQFRQFAVVVSQASQVNETLFP